MRALLCERHGVCAHVLELCTHRQAHPACPSATCTWPCTPARPPLGASCIPGDIPRLAVHMSLLPAAPLLCSVGSPWWGIRVQVPLTAVQFPDLMLVGSDVAPNAFPSEEAPRVHLRPHMPAMPAAHAYHVCCTCLPCLLHVPVLPAALHAVDAALVDGGACRAAAMRTARSAVLASRRCVPWPAFPISLAPARDPRARRRGSRPPRLALRSSAPACPLCRQ